MPQLFCLQKARYNAKSIEQLQLSESRKVVGIFGNLLRKKYPKFQRAIPFNELLDWHLWPGFLRIIGRYYSNWNVHIKTIVCTMMKFILSAHSHETP